jgi:hypothetical protein
VNVDVFSEDTKTEGARRRLGDSIAAASASRWVTCCR